MTHEQIMFYLAIFGAVCLVSFAIGGLYHLFMAWTDDEIKPIKRRLFTSPWFLRRRYGLRWK